MYALQFDRIYPDCFFQFLQDFPQCRILSDLKTLFSTICECVSFIFILPV